MIDVDDRIYPRAKSRIGTKYQATVPDFDSNNQRSVSPASDLHSNSSVSSTVAAVAIKSSPVAQCNTTNSKPHSSKLDRKGKSVVSPHSSSTVQKLYLTHNGSSKKSGKYIYPYI
jgi:hypothetical protein